MTNKWNEPKENFVPLVLTWQLRQALQSAVSHFDVSLPSYFFAVYAVLVARHTQSTQLSLKLAHPSLNTETKIEAPIGKNPFFTDLLQSINAIIPPLPIYPVQLQAQHANLLLTLELDLFDGEIHPYLAYPFSKIGRTTVLQFLEHYRTLLIHLTEPPRLYIESIPLRTSQPIS